MSNFEQPPSEQDVESRRKQRALYVAMIEVLYEDLSLTLTINQARSGDQFIIHKAGRDSVSNQITALELTVTRIDREIKDLERQLGIENPRDPEPPTHHPDEWDGGEDG